MQVPGWLEGRTSPARVPHGESVCAGPLDEARRGAHVVRLSRGIVTWANRSPLSHHVREGIVTGSSALPARLKYRLVAQYIPHVCSHHPHCVGDIVAIDAGVPAGCAVLGRLGSPPWPKAFQAATSWMRASAPICWRRHTIAPDGTPATAMPKSETW